jgi:hypothetical protein
MESMPPARRKKINVAGQASASHAKGPADHNDDRPLLTFGLEKSPCNGGKVLLGIDYVMEKIRQRVHRNQQRSRITHVAAEFI